MLKETSLGRPTGGHSGPISALGVCGAQLVSGSHDTTVKVEFNSDLVKLYRYGLQHIHANTPS
jgi:hypothetical protein